MRFQKSQPAGAATLVPHSASTGLLDTTENMVHHPPHEKRAPTKYTKKLAAFQTLENSHGSYGTI